MIKPKNRSFAGVFRKTRKYRVFLSGNWFNTWYICSTAEPTGQPRKTREAEMPARKKITTVSESTERLTGFDSHGSRYIRLALPREPFNAWETDLNRWTVTVLSDGSFTAVPVRELISVEPKIAKGAKVAEA